MHHQGAMTITSFRDLLVWQRAMTLTERVYELTNALPKSEQYGLASQMKRAAVSMPSNIAEGHTRKTGHFLEHLNTASGSNSELQTQLELTHRLKLLSRSDVAPVAEEAAVVGRLLHALAGAVAKQRKKADPIPNP